MRQPCRVRVMFRLKFFWRGGVKSRAVKEIAVREAASYWLHADRCGEVERALLLRVRDGGDGEARFVGVGALATAGVANDGAEFREEGPEAVHGGVVVQDPLVDLS